MKLKWNLRFAAGSFLVLGLVACGGDDSPQRNNPDNTNPDAPSQVAENELLDLNTFIVNNEVFSWIRVAYEDNVKTLDDGYYDARYNDGFRSGVEEDYFPKSGPQPVYGHKLYSEISEETRQQKNWTLIYDLQDDKSDRFVKYTVKYVPISIAGISRADGNYQQSSGVITPLTYMDKVPDSITFPEGSLCYMEQISSSDDLFLEASYDFGVIPPITLEDWTASRIHRNKKYKGWDYQFSQTQAVGSNNEYEAVLLVFKDADGQRKYDSGMLQDGNIIDVFYQPQGTVEVDASVEAGFRCHQFNDTAAAFLKKQALIYYPPAS